MCTVTLVPKAGAKHAFRMACSRDENHRRADAQVPIQPAPNPHAEERLALMPIDPSSGGTWVAVNDAGLALTLLNDNLPDPPVGRGCSRGTVIPMLTQAATIQEAVTLAKQIQRDRMMPFRLVICDGQTLLLWRSIETIDQADVTPWTRTPTMFTSSGLGDHLVQGPRQTLFDQWFDNDPSTHLERQRDFHRHQWPGKEHLSVNMYRKDARTVSYTVVDVESAIATLQYYAQGPTQTTPPHLSTLTRSQR